MENSPAKEIHILVVEDDSPMREAALFELAKNQIYADTAVDGEEALQKISQKNYDIILLDLMLPKVNGFEIIKSVRGNPKHTFVRIIVMTNLSQEGDVQHAMALGANDYCIKSDTNIHELIGKVLKYIK